ncbi:Crocetin glucosyltransferase 3 [Platanthera zijinensis]|uniref:Glycosyltransferase n=1 Tax=Platanthera zijinensis TaxID=2320716 RepID=A0AAP0BBY8_9ASPA
MSSLSGDLFPTAQMAEPRQHIVMLPFMAQAQTSLRHHHRHHPLNVQHLRSSLPPTSSIHLAALPFSSSDHGLPPETENSASISQIDLLPRLMFASETLAPQFDLLLADLTDLHRCPPLFIISDFFTGWSIHIARARGIPHFSFSTSGGFGTSAFMSLWLHLPHRLTDADPFQVPGFPDRFCLRRSQMSHYMRAADGSDDWSVFLRRNIRCSLGSDALLCNTVEEIEPYGADLLRKISGLPVLTVGSCRKAETTKLDSCLEWLESHRPASVLFVSFGSQNTIGAAQMRALAEGLEASGVAFIWVVRPPYGFDMNGDFKSEWLPDGFEARMGEKKRGLVVRRWAPQIGILSHEATGGFLSHCGWNSVMESLSRGVPVIGWPVASEQFYNSMLMEEEMGVGVEMTRGVVGEIDGGKVERVVRMVMEGDKGKEMRQRAARCRELIMAAQAEVDGEQKGSSVRAIDRLFEVAIAGSNETSKN